MRTITAAIDNIFSFDLPISEFSIMAFFWIGQKPVLVWYDFLAVFDFKNLALFFCFVLNDHIKFAGSKFELKDISL